MPSVALETQGGRKVALGLAGFAMVHDRATGIGLVEATGEVTPHDQCFCRIEKGRAVVWAEDGRKEPVGSVSVEGRLLEVEGEMKRYVIGLTWAE